MKGGVSVRGVEHIGIIAADSEKLARWYTELFGASEYSRSPNDPPIVFLGFGGGSLLEIVPGTTQDAVPSDHIHMSFSVESIDRAVLDLEEAGVSLERPVFNAYEGSPVAFLRDPEGNLLQIVERKSGLPQPR